MSTECEHAEDCECIITIDDANTAELIAELKCRGHFEVNRRGVEAAYEALLRGNPVEAGFALRGALYPNGEADLIAIRVQPALSRAPGAHGQVGKNDGGGRHHKEKAA